MRTVSQSAKVYRMPVGVVVKKYLDVVYVSKHIYRASESDFLGVYLLNGMARKTIQVQPVDYALCLEMGYTEEWRFKIPRRYEDRPVLPQTHVERFNKLITKLIKTEIYNSLEVLRIRGEDNYIENGLDAFLEKYDLSLEEFTDERFRKLYFRYRKQKQEGRSEFSNFHAGLLFGK